MRLLLDHPALLLAGLVVVLFAVWVAVRRATLLRLWAQWRELRRRRRTDRDEFAAGLFEHRRKPYCVVESTDEASNAASVEAEATPTSKQQLDVAPWLNMLIRPRSTIRAIASLDPSLHVMLLASLFGIHWGLGLYVTRRGECM